MMKKGDRVRIIREDFGHPYLNDMTNAVGTITEVADPYRDTRKTRYEVTFDYPNGPQHYITHFPLYDEDLELFKE